jgi:hypothetical protein
MGERTPGNAKVDVPAGRAAEKPGYSKVTSIAHLKLQISEKFRNAKTTSYDIPSHHGTEEIPPSPKKSWLDKTRNALAQQESLRNSECWQTLFIYLLNSFVPFIPWGYATPTNERTTETGQRPSVVDHNIISPTPSSVRCAQNPGYESP